MGVYAITQGTLTAGDNYIITFVSADFTVKAKETPDNPPETPDKPTEEGGSGKFDCCTFIKKFFKELCTALKEFFSYPFRLSGKVISTTDISC